MVHNEKKPIENTDITGGFFISNFDTLLTYWLLCFWHQLGISSELRNLRHTCRVFLHQFSVLKLFQRLFDNRLLSTIQLFLKIIMCTVLKQYLNQNPENSLNDRETSKMTSPVLMHYYIPPSKIQGAQPNNAGEISIIYMSRKKKSWKRMVNRSLMTCSPHAFTKINNIPKFIKTNFCKGPSINDVGPFF